MGENGIMEENRIVVAAEYYRREWSYGREWRIVVEAGEYGRAGIDKAGLEHLNCPNA